MNVNSPQRPVLIDIAFMASSVTPFQGWILNVNATQGVALG